MGCPINCQTCSNGVCSLCGQGYYLDYQTICQSCPIAGTKVCTISSLISCLNNYWLDNNAANCIACDPNCQQCSSTTRCSTCLPAFYLNFNFTCSACPSQCATCSSNTTCTSCLTSGSFFNSSKSACISGTVTNCVQYDSGGSCTVCNNSSYMSNSQCLAVSPTQLISQCQTYLLSNGSISCTNCSQGFFNASSGQCIYGCSLLCTSCYGPHFGLCFSCIPSASLYNLHCLPSYNINSGSAYQLYFSPFSNPTFFQGGIYRMEDTCIWEDIYGGSSFWFSLSGLQSYQFVLAWKVYVISGTNNTGNVSYSLTINNSIKNSTVQFTASNGYSCNNRTALVDKQTLTLASIANNNTLTITTTSNTIYIA